MKERYQRALFLEHLPVGCLLLSWFKDTHREKEPSNKTPALRKSMNMGIWAVGTLSQLFIRGS